MAVFDKAGICRLVDTFTVATGSEQAFSKDAQTRVAFQAKARKLLAEVEKLNKQERATLFIRTTGCVICVSHT